MNTSQIGAFSAVVLALASSSAWATNGYFPHGYGMKAEGMGGASIASTDNAFGGANNPAAAAWAGRRMDGGLDVFMPDRHVSRTGSPVGLNAEIDSGSKQFLVPSFGYNTMFGPNLGAGITVYGNGGMNTDYPGGQIAAGVCGATAANVLCGGGRVGVNLQQLILAPTVAWKFAPRHSVGLSALVVTQTFKAEGLQMFASMSSAPAKVTNNGNDTSNGLGLRLGYLGQWSDSVSIGASYSPKTRMSKFSQYAGLFADGGSFDIPENFGLGLSVQASRDVRLALDLTHIAYSRVSSVGNPSTNAQPLGAAGAPGFGWRDVDTVKLGVEWQATPGLMLRAGVNQGNNPVQGRDVTFNIVAPGVITQHYTLGATWTTSPSTEWTMAYMTAPAASASGLSMFNAFTGGNAGSETVRMRQSSLGVAFGLKF